MKDWSDDKTNKYIDTYTKSDSNNLLQVTDFEEENSLKKEMKNQIYRFIKLIINIKLLMMNLNLI